jgi:nucleoid-associated protein YgaU
VDTTASTQSFSSTISQAQQQVQGLLTELAQSPNALVTLRQSFGESIDKKLVETLLEKFRQGDFSDLPAIEALPTSVLKGGNGGFSSETARIYLGENLLIHAAKTGDITGVTGVLLEESGHAIDSLLNTQDTPGDEGAIFRQLIEGASLSVLDLQELRLEDDAVIISLQGKDVLVEESSRPYTIRSGDTLWAIAVQNLGNGNRWREITKSSGQSFTDDEAKRLQIGQVVYIPEPPAPTPTPSPAPTPSPVVTPNRSSYTIKSGDTLWAIAQRNLGNGDRWREITKENGQSFTDDEARRLQIGQVVYLAGSNTIPAPAPTPAPAILPSRYTYTMRSGDTLSAIAQRELGDANRWREITKENRQPFTDDEARRLPVGQVVYLPGNKPTPQPSPTPTPTPALGLNRRSYTIRSGDVLSTIAQRELGNANRWREITKENGQPFTDAETRQLKVGQTVLLPGDSTPKPTPNSGNSSGSSSNGLGRLPISVAEANNFFKMQYRGTYNSDGPNSSGNCGPTSLAIILKSLGREPSGLSVQQSIDRASRLMGRDPKSNWTSWQQLKTGIANGGGKPEEINSWSSLDSKLSQGKPVMLNGFYGVDWRRQFPNYGQTGGGNVSHVNSVLGKTQSGKYIVADPMYRGGTVEMTRQQLSVFFGGKNPVGIAVAGISPLINPAIEPSRNVGAPTYNVNFSGTVMSTTGVNLRNSPVLSDRSNQNRGYNQRLSFDAWTTGESVKDLALGSPDNRWFRVTGTNYWVPSAFIDGNPPISNGISNTGNQVLQGSDNFISEIGNSIQRSLQKANNYPQYLTRFIFPTTSFSHVDYETFAKNFIYLADNSSSLTPSITAFQDHGYSIENLGNRYDNGFFAVGLLPKDKNKTPILIIRGTNKPNDVLADVDPSGIALKRFYLEGVREKIEGWIKNSVENKKYKKPDIIGHSLGGAVAQLVATNFSSRINEVVTFNSPGIRDSEVSRYRSQSTYNKVTHYITEGDVVSFGGDAFIPGTFTLFQGKPIDNFINYQPKTFLEVLHPVIKANARKEALILDATNAYDNHVDIVLPTTRSKKPLDSISDLIPTVSRQAVEIVRKTLGFGVEYALARLRFW